jgi:hypothetical protein
MIEKWLKKLAIAWSNPIREATLFVQQFMKVTFRLKRPSYESGIIKIP